MHYSLFVKINDGCSVIQSANGIHLFNLDNYPFINPDNDTYACSCSPVEVSYS